MIFYVVVAGKLEMGEENWERNYKYISKEFWDVNEALKDWETCKDYHFSEIEVFQTKGDERKRIGTLNPSAKY